MKGIKKTIKKINIMDLQTWTYCWGNIALYIGIAIWSRAGSTKRIFMLQRISPLANGMATATTG
jgi:cation/acetate symporter